MKYCIVDVDRMLYEINCTTLESFIILVEKIVNDGYKIKNVLEDNIYGKTIVFIELNRFLGVYQDEKSQ